MRGVRTMSDEPVEAPSTREMKLATLFTIALVFGLIGWTAYGAWRAMDLWEQAQDAVRRFQWVRAEEYLAEYARYKKEEDEVLRLRAYVAIQRGDEEAALRYLERIPDFSAHAAMAYMTRSSLLLKQCRYNEAEIALRGCLRHDPYSTYAMRDLLMIYALEQRDEDYEAQAWQMFDVGMLADSLDAIRLLAFGTPMIPPGRLRPEGDEVEALRLAVRADPQGPYLRPALAERLAARGQLAEAEEVLKPWLDAHPDDPAALNARIACLMEAGDHDEAAKWMEEAADRADKFGRFWLHKGDLLLARGEAEEAIASYRKAIEFQPRWVEPRNRLAQALRTSGRTEEAASTAVAVERALDLKAMAPESVRPAVLTMEDVRKATGICRDLGRGREAESWTMLTQVKPEDLINVQRHEEFYSPRGRGPVGR